MDVVVVESPAKAKTINKYLGSGYTVLASYGHVRDLPAKNGSVDPDHDFDMVWEIGENSEKHLNAIIAATKGADHLFLATDPDREGEAISWHVRQVLESRNALNGISVSRIVFHEITKDAIQEAMHHPRDLDYHLIEAYLARRALDYLVGFTLSPVLWRKLPGSRSAGRVQSVALRLICERESEIEAFNPIEYWTVDADFGTLKGATLTARLTHLDSAKLDRYALGDEEAARRAAETVAAGAFTVRKVERKSVSRNAQPPFTTSTLQQEASRKLGFGAQRTMRVAQRLYEGIALDGETVGLITYMRTDSVNLAAEAVSASRALIGRLYGPDYVPATPNTYRNRARNAQEAHEGIRPTDVTRLPKDVAGFLDQDGRKLYDLIWKRTVASAMKAAGLEQVGIDVATADNATVLRATGSIVVFDGFLKIYKEDRDDPADDDDGAGRMLPAVNEREGLSTGPVKPEQHHTKPPPRYSEASLVGKMEELGIGRPSTYASIITVLQDRDYVRLEGRRFFPEDRGRVVTAFLSEFFNRYIQYNFTAELEDRLDGVAKGEINWKSLLKDFWDTFHAAILDTKDLKISEVIDLLDAELGRHFFPPRENGEDSRICPACKTGRLGLRLGRGGPFIGCSSYPECRYTRALSPAGADDEAAGLNLPMVLGKDPATDLDVSLCKGPFGFYVQLGEQIEKEKPKRAGLPKTVPPADVTLEMALGLLSLPRDIGPHPEGGVMIVAGIGRYGPYIKHGPVYASLSDGDDVLSIGLNRAVVVLSEKPAGRGATPLRELGVHPDDGKPVNLFKGRYGPYVKHGRINASLPKGMGEDEITLNAAILLISARAAKGPRAKKAPAKKAAARKKTSGKKATRRKKSPARKTAARKPAAGD